jgi:hypothetical protein
MTKLARFKVVATVKIHEGKSLGRLYIDADETTNLETSYLISTGILFTLTFPF